MAHAKDVQRYKNVTFHSETVKTRLERNSILRLNYCNMWAPQSNVRSFFRHLLGILEYTGNM